MRKLMLVPEKRKNKMCTNQIKGILESRIPVLVLLDTLLVGLGELAVALQGKTVLQCYYLFPVLIMIKFTYTAAENWLMGWRSLGKFLIMVATCSGMEALLARSWRKTSTWLAVGTSEVNNNQRRASGRGSAPPTFSEPQPQRHKLYYSIPLALGSCAWTSGMERPRNLIPCT